MPMRNGIGNPRRLILFVGPGLQTLYLILVANPELRETLHTDAGAIGLAIRGFSTAVGLAIITLLLLAIRRKMHYDSRNNLFLMS